nr:MAG TPA: hypothetical protein [Bacteriophage sp.]
MSSTVLNTPYTTNGTSVKYGTPVFSVVTFPLSSIQSLFPFSSSF